MSRPRAPACARTARTLSRRGGCGAGARAPCICWPPSWCSARFICSPPLMQACAAGGITIVLLDRAGRFQARIEGPVTGNVLLRRAQYRASDRPDEIVREFRLGKIANQRAVLQRALRDHDDELPPSANAAIEAAVSGWAHPPARLTSRPRASTRCAATRAKRPSLFRRLRRSDPRLGPGDTSFAVARGGRRSTP